MHSSQPLYPDNLTSHPSSTAHEVVLAPRKHSHLLLVHLTPVYMALHCWLQGPQETRSGPLNQGQAHGPSFRWQRLCPMSVWPSLSQDNLGRGGSPPPHSPTFWWGRVGEERKGLPITKHGESIEPGNAWFPVVYDVSVVKTQQFFAGSRATG